MVRLKGIETDTAKSKNIDSGSLKANSIENIEIQNRVIDSGSLKAKGIETESYKTDFSIYVPCLNFTIIKNSMYIALF